MTKTSSERYLLEFEQEAVGLLCCCNQGSQYASGACRDVLKKYGSTAFKAR